MLRRVSNIVVLLRCGWACAETRITRYNMVGAACDALMSSTVVSAPHLGHRECGECCQESQGSRLPNPHPQNLQHKASQSLISLAFRHPVTQALSLSHHVISCRTASLSYLQPLQGMEHCSFVDPLNDADEEISCRMLGWHSPQQGWSPAGPTAQTT